MRRKLKWKVTFTPGSKIKRFFQSTKDKEEKESPGIYEIPCQSPCTAKYLGQSLNWRERIGQHQQAVKNHSYDSSAVCRHIMKNKFSHRMDWSNSRLICKERDSQLRKIKEGLYIQQSKSTNKLMNDDDGLVLSDAWQPLIPKLKKQTVESFDCAEVPVITYNQYNLRSSVRSKKLV